MLNGLEKTLERKLPEGEQRWEVKESPAACGVEQESCPVGWPSSSDT
jgi:hypothetical protein